MCKLKNKNAHENVNDITSAQLQIENNHTKSYYQMKIKIEYENDDKNVNLRNNI